LEIILQSWVEQVKSHAGRSVSFATVAGAMMQLFHAYGLSVDDFEGMKKPASGPAFQ
jgi:hypothetical protein